MMIVKKLSVPVNFDLSFLKIRWSDHLFVKVKNKIAGEGVVYGGGWDKAERLARQMAEMKFGTSRGDLTACEQVFITQISNLKSQISKIQIRNSNLKIKVGRNVFEDIKTLIYLKNVLRFPNKIRIDANQGYSLKQLQYLIPTLVDLGIEYVEEPVKKRDLKEAIEILHKNGLKIILDETLIQIPTSRSGTRNDRLVSLRGVPQMRDDAAIWLEKFPIDAINIKLSRIGDINEAIHLIKLAKKHRVKVIIGCSEELERGMKAIYAFGHIAKKEGVLLEIEGFGPLRLMKKSAVIPKWVNRLENLNLILWHRIRQIIFDLWWQGARAIMLVVKKTKVLSALSVRMTKLTSKSRYSIHPKHLIKNTSEANFLKYIKGGDIVLDVGCGNGQNAIKAAGKAGKVFGFDTDDRMLNIANQTNIINKTEEVLKLEKTSAEETFPYKKNMFDKVMFFGVLEHLSNRDFALTEVYRVLKRGGKLILDVPNSDTKWKITQRRFGINSVTDPDHKIEYNKQQIEKMLTINNFRIEKLLPTAYDTPWAGMIDILGGISLNLYGKLLKWKWAMACKHPEDSISYLVVAEKV